MCRSLVVPAVVLALGAALPSAVRSQELRDMSVAGRLADPAASVAFSTDLDLDAGTAAKLSAAGLVGGAIGFFGGAYLGAWIGDSRDDGIDDLDALHGALIGAAIGESALLPAGVHLANGRRGSYWMSALVSAGIAAGGIGLLEAAHWDAPAAPIIAAAVPLAQLGASIAIERSTD